MIRVVVREEPRINVNVRDVCVSVAGQAYDGPYEITPDIAAQTLPTNGRYLTGDVVIDAVPMSVAPRSRIDNMF